MQCKMFHSPYIHEDGESLEDQINKFLNKNPKISVEKIIFTPLLANGTTQTIIAALFYKVI